MNESEKARLIEEQILHKLGYKVWDIPRLTIWEKYRLVRGYMLMEGVEEAQVEREQKIEEYLKEREQIGKSRHRNKDNR